MLSIRKPLFITLLLIVLSVSLLASDWSRTASVRFGRCEADADIKSPGKSLFMFGGSYEFWYKDVVSVGPYVYFSQLHAGPMNETHWVDNDISTRNFRTYIAGLDVKLRFRPNWRWINLWYPDHFISRVAPYVYAGGGAITFDPSKRSSYGSKIQGIHIINDSTYRYTEYDKRAGVFPVFGGGFTLFSRMGVTGDVGVNYHIVNSDFLDGVKMNNDKDAFYTYYVALTIGSSKPVAPPVVLPPEPEPEPIIEIEPELTVLPPIRNVGYQEGTTSYDVLSNVAWSVSENCDWFTVTPMSGVDNYRLTINYDKNTTFQPKTCYITVTGGGLTRTVSIVQEPAPEPKYVFERDVSLIIEGVNFKTDSADLTEGAKQILDEVVITLKDFPEVTLDIQGHTDSDASDAYNMDLSRRRSMSVRKYLIDNGIAANRLTTSWYGERRPIAPNTTPLGKAKNRRIEFVRTDKE